MPRMSLRLPSMMSEQGSSAWIRAPGFEMPTFRADIGELYAARVDELERFVHVLRLLYAHSRRLVVPPE